MTTTDLIETFIAEAVRALKSRNDRKRPRESARSCLPITAPTLAGSPNGTGTRAWIHTDPGARKPEPYWTVRLRKEYECLGATLVPMKIGEKTSFVMLPLECKLRLGYTNKYMTANITKIEIVDGKNTDLHIDKPVYAIYLANVCVGRGGLMFEKEAKEWAKENGKPITSGCLE